MCYVKHKTQNMNKTPIHRSVMTKVLLPVEKLGYEQTNAVQNRSFKKQFRTVNALLVLNSGI